MSNPQLKSRQERLRQKSAQAAVLNQFGLGSAKSRKGLGDKLLRDSDEDGEDNNEQNGDHSNGHLDSSADEGVGPVNEDQMVAEDEDQIAVQSTPGNSLFSAPPGTDDYFTGGESDSKRDRDKQNSAEGDQEGKPDNGQDIKKGQDGNDKNGSVQYYPQFVSEKWLTWNYNDFTSTVWLSWTKVTDAS